MNPFSAKSVFDKYSGKIKALDETLDILGRENVEHLIGKYVYKILVSLDL